MVGYALAKDFRQRLSQMTVGVCYVVLAPWDRFWPRGAGRLADAVRLVAASHVAL